MSPWQPGTGPHVKGAAVHVMSGWSQASWSAGPQLSAVLSFGEGHPQCMAPSMYGSPLQLLSVGPAARGAGTGRPRDEFGPMTQSRICASVPESRIRPLGLCCQLGAKPEAGCRAGGWLRGTQHCCPQVSGYRSLLGRAGTRLSKRTHLFTAGVNPARR